MNSTKRICFSFDFETSGPNISEYDVLGLGISVISNEMEELESILLPTYFPKNVKFEQKCWDEFWWDKLELLKTLEYDGPLEKEERLKEVIEIFQKTRSKWETHCKTFGIGYQIVSDNTVFDGMIINQLISKYLPNEKGLPFNASDGNYAPFYETQSMFKGFLLGMDPGFGLKNDWGLDKRLKNSYKIPGPKKIYNHNPANDAYNIAFDFIVLMRISEGDFAKSSDDSNPDILEWGIDEKMPPVVTKQQMLEWANGEDTRWFIEEWKEHVLRGTLHHHVIVVKDETEKQKVIKQRKWEKNNSEWL